MAERVDAGVERVKASGAHAVTDRGRTEAELEQITAAEEPPLRLGALEDRRFPGGCAKGDAYRHLESNPPSGWLPAELCAPCRAVACVSARRSRKADHFGGSGDAGPEERGRPEARRTASALASGAASLSSARPGPQPSRRRARSA